LDISTPSVELVDAYLAEIAKGYGVVWSSPLRKIEPQVNEPIPYLALTLNVYMCQDGSGTDLQEQPTTETLPDYPGSKEGSGEQLTPTAVDTGEPKTAGDAANAASPEDDFQALAKRFAALKKK
jgi:vacuolar protein sorting-associated protein IST1